MTRFTLDGLMEAIIAEHEREDAANSLLIHRLTPDAITPTRGSHLAAGYDLYAPLPVLIPCGGRLLVDTQIAVAIPPGHYGRIAPRSGHALKLGMHILAGVIDEDYRGSIGVLILNAGHEPVRLPAGSKIAQLILERISTPPVVEVEALPTTARGEAGYGSTGL